MMRYEYAPGQFTILDNDPPQPRPAKRKANGAAKANAHANEDWLADCVKGETGKPLPILANVLIALRAIWPDHFAFDEMGCASMLMHPLRGENSFEPRLCSDVDAGIIQERRLQHLGLKRITKETVHQAIDIRASDCRFHPVRDYWAVSVRLGNRPPKPVDRAHRAKWVP
jgi:hypothetical protein